MKKVFLFTGVIFLLLLGFYFYVEYSYDNKSDNGGGFVSSRPSGSVDYNGGGSGGGGWFDQKDTGISGGVIGGGGGGNVGFMDKAKSVFGGGDSSGGGMHGNYAMESMSIDGGSAPMSRTNNNMAFTVGADQDIELFRDNIANGYIPNPDVITYNGVYSDYHFGLPDGECNTMFCPLVSASSVENMDEEQDTRVQIGLGSNIKEEDFQRQPTNFVLVIDRSGSMGSPINQYYYGSVNDVFVDDYDYCDDDLIYFQPGHKCIQPAVKKMYKEEYERSLTKTKMELAMEAAAKMVDKLQEDDRIGVVVFDDVSKVVHPLKKVSKIDKDTFKEHLLDIYDNGGTNMEAGMKEGLELFDDDLMDDGYQNRMIFITDAMPNLGNYSPRGIESYVEDAVKDDIFFTFIGVGVDFQQQFVQKIGKHKGNNYFFVGSGYDFYRRLIDEFDYNFFPMIFDLSFKVNNPDAIDDVYGLDTYSTDDDEFFHINTLFPTPPTADGYRGSIILLKLKDEADKDLEFEVEYETYLGENQEAKVSLSRNDFGDNDVIKKGVLLTTYVDSLKEAIDDDDTEILDDVEEYLEENKEIFDGDDEEMYEKELETIEKLKKLIKNGAKVEKDYWNE